MQDARYLRFNSMPVIIAVLMRLETATLNLLYACAYSLIADNTTMLIN